LLHDVMGYAELQVNPKAYTSGLLYGESITMCRRLAELAKSRGRRFGAKFSNTLEVVNHRDFFPETEEIMYLSGAPLHVITLSLADRFRREIGPEMPISFSAGVDRKNFANMVACGLLPITTCTDLLKTGGYGRLPPYLQELDKAMRAVGARTVDEYRLKARGQQESAGGDPVQAGWLNTPIVTAETQADVRYSAAKNRMVPRRINSHLVLFDCITCDKCIPVCPNDANFAYFTTPVDTAYRDVEVAADGTIAECGDEQRFTVERQEQIANFADFCNHCGNCDTFCPEWDGPYIKKPSFFGSRAAFDAGAPHDGFLLEGQPPRLTLHGRIDGVLCRLEQRVAGVERSEPPDSLEGRSPQRPPPQPPNDHVVYHYHDGTVTIVVQNGRVDGLADSSVVTSKPHRVDMGRLHAMVSLLVGITSAERVHQVNTRLLALAE